MKKIPEQEVENLKNKINRYFEDAGLPARLNYLSFIVEGDEITTNISLSPTGDITAEIWRQVNNYVEREVEKFLKKMSKKG